MNRSMHCIRCFQLGLFQNRRTQRLERGLLILTLIILFGISLLILTSCAQTGYNRSYIISDYQEEENGVPPSEACR